MSQRKRTHTQLAGLQATGGEQTNETVTSMDEEEVNANTAAGDQLPTSSSNSTPSGLEEQPRARRRLNEEGTETVSTNGVAAKSGGIDAIPSSAISEDEPKDQGVTTKIAAGSTSSAIAVTVDTEMKDVEEAPSLPSDSITRQISTSSSLGLVGVNGDEAITLRPTAISFTTVMANLCMAKVLQFSRRKDRIDFTRVSKWCHRSVHHPSAWLSANFFDGDETKTPQWIRSVVSGLFVDSNGFSASFLQFTQLRRLVLSNVKRTNMTVSDTRRALQRLKLEELTLFEVEVYDIWSAIFVPSEINSDDVDDVVHHPAVWSWCQTLKRVEMTSQARNDLFLPIETAFLTLSKRTWPKLQHFEWCTRKQPAQEASVKAFHSLFTSSRLSSLTTLDVNIFHRENDMVATIIEEMMKVELPQLTSFSGGFYINNEEMHLSLSWPSLTYLEMRIIHESFQLSTFVNLRELHLGQKYQGTALALFESIGHHSMPHLTKVTLPTVTREVNDKISPADSDQIRTLMSQMTTLTGLRIYIKAKSIYCTWIDLIASFPSVKHLKFERFSTGNFLSRAASFVPVIAAISSLECFSLEDDLILSFGDLSALALLWSTRQVDCRLNTISLKLPFRYGESPIEDDTMKAMLLSLAQLPQLTDLVIIRRPDEDDVNVRRKSPNEKTLSASYLPQLTRLKHLKRLHIDDYHYPIQWCVLEEWSRNSESFQYLRYLRIAFVKDFPSQTISYLTSLPHLHTIDFINTGLTSTIEPSVFETTVRELIRTANEGRRQPALEYEFF